LAKARLICAKKSFITTLMGWTNGLLNTNLSNLGMIRHWMRNTFQTNQLIISFLEICWWICSSKNTETRTINQKKTQFSISF